MPNTAPFLLMSWNVNSVNARLERLLAVLTRHRPDALCLQELKCEESRFPFDPIRALGYEALVSGQKTYNGVAILSRKPIESSVFPLKDSELPFAARAVGARIQGVWVYSVYVPNGQEVGAPKYEYKLKWMAELAAFLKAHHTPGESIAVCGDFNVAPTALDVYDPEHLNERILCSTPERRALADITNDFFEDTFRMHHKEGGLFTWWDYREVGFPLNKGLRIDFILASRPLAKRCTAAAIDRDERKGTKPSDHAPICAEFER